MNSVDVWRVDLDSVPATLQHVLSRDEIQRAERFRFHVHACRYIAGRAVLRVLLSRYTGTAPHAFEFGYSGTGKPFLSSTPSLQFNVAHSDNVALIAFSRGVPVGIDVEKLRNIEEAVALGRMYFSPAEGTELEGIGQEGRSAGFLRIWTRKEAVVKAGGMGLGAELDSFSVTPLSEPTIRVGMGGVTFSVQELRTCEQEVAAVALAGPPAAVRLEQYCAGDSPAELRESS